MPTHGSNSTRRGCSNGPDRAGFSPISRRTFNDDRLPIESLRPLFPESPTLQQFLFATLDNCARIQFPLASERLSDGARFAFWKVQYRQRSEADTFLGNPG